MNQKTLLGTGGVIIGLVLGFGGGWLARGPKQAASDVTGAPVVSQPSGNLTKENAMALIVADYKLEGPGQWCRLENTSQKSESTLALLVQDSDGPRCAEQLESAGIVTRGVCVEGTEASCYWRAITKGPRAKPSKESAVYFGCGEFEVKSVVSVTTNGASATVVLEREFAPADVITKVNSCKFTKPEAGRATRTYEFRRDDSGDWRISKRP